VSIVGAATSDDATVRFLQVGQGDSTLVIDEQSSEAILIDCPAGKEDVVESVLIDAGSPDLKAVILTHWDADHFGGILAIVRDLSPAAFHYNHDTIMAWDAPKSMRLAALRELAEPGFPKVDKRAAERGASGTLGSNVEWRLLSPFHDQLTRAVAFGDRNLGSGVVQITIRGRTFVVGGDADGRVWARMTEEGDVLSCDVLRWPHHGALNPHGGLDEAGLMAVTSPSHIVISTGTGNRYGHPVDAALDAASGAARLGCTEVTKKCHSPLPAGHVHCGGTLIFRVDRDGQLLEDGGWSQLDLRIDGWVHPRCRLSGSVAT
jgi:competence protein ComEC